MRSCAAIITKEGWKAPAVSFVMNQKGDNGAQVSLFLEIFFRLDTYMLFQKSKQRSEYFYEAKTNKSIFEHSFPPIVLQKMLKESVWQFLPHSFLPTLICFTISLASYNNYNIKTTNHFPDQQYSIWYENFKGSSTCINWI